MAYSIAQYFVPPTPIKKHASRTVSENDALSFLSKYIAAADDDLGMRPGAILTPDGPTEAMNGGATAGGTSLVLHNLRRVEASLRGEQLDPPPRLPKVEDETIEENPAEGGSKRRRSENGVYQNGGDPGWQDPMEYEEQQEEIEGDVGDRVAGAVVDGAEAERNLMDAEKSIDKEARKKAKKERKQKEKTDREKARQDTAK